MLVVMLFRLSRVIVFMCLVMFATPLVVDAQAGIPKTKIVFWGWGQQSRHIEAVLPSFYEKYPNIEVELQMFAFQEAHEKLTVGMASGTVPDVSMI